MSSAPYPDEPHIEQIRTALWRGGEFGRAAILVGAGFSFNADPATVEPRPFLTWNGLTDRLARDLHPGSTVQDGLRLAEEYEAAHGRQRLDQLIVESIPDSHWQPGHIHRLLMSLPWADVFTTNYDTLLERAALQATGRRYDIVRTMQEIPAASRPRLVKLHGSFPSNYPFILTEEDFRSYPRRFAPFVNTVQQSMMENVFCLIGFSGTDPNFLAWSGWVRDNLGPNAPVVYLCGLFSFNDAQRQLLNARNVTIIDLSQRFPAARFPDPADRHRIALEWFLLSLEAARPINPVLWPDSNPPDGTPPSPGVPPPLPRRSEPHRVERLSPPPS